MILTVYILGIWLHHTADVQKYFVLRARKGLITDGLFSMSRNPNYLGEMFIYAAFAGKISLSFYLAHFIYYPPLSVRLESPGVVVVLVPAPRGLDSPLLPLLAAQGQVHVAIQGVVQIHLTHRYMGVMRTQGTG